MTETQWQAFSAFREKFRAQVAEWSRDAALMRELATLADEARRLDKVPDYPIQTPVVYNKSLDAVTPETDLQVIVIGDNPGKDEQLLKNNRYLVGLSGKVAETYFKNHPELGFDFRANSIILNKTPVHTAKTKELAYLAAHGSEAVRTLIRESQLFMARETAALHAALCMGRQPPELWLVGYAELKPKGVFSAYTRELTAFYTGNALSAGAPSDTQERFPLAAPARRPMSDTQEQPPLAAPAQRPAPACGAAPYVRVFQHFSMNRFFIDVRDHSDPQKTLAQNIAATGFLRRKEILGF